MTIAPAYPVCPGRPCGGRKVSSAGFDSRRESCKPEGVYCIKSTCHASIAPHPLQACHRSGRFSPRCCPPQRRRVRQDTARPVERFPQRTDRALSPDPKKDRERQTGGLPHPLGGLSLCRSSSSDAATPSDPEGGRRVERRRGLYDVEPARDQRHLPGKDRK